MNCVNEKKHPVGFSVKQSVVNRNKSQLEDILLLLPGIRISPLNSSHLCFVFRNIPASKFNLPNHTFPNLFQD
jgi:hypothetical protein